jgi:myo-inositol-1(or 4)-monophosphatase
MTHDTAALLELATHVSRRAGALLIERFAEPARGVETKTTSTDPVSDADRDAESLILEAIREHRPGDGVLAEEGGAGETTTELTWVIDPLDGTVNFLFGIPVWCVSIGVEDASGGLVGVVHDPNRDETFSAIRGEGARLNGAPIEVSTRKELASALVGTGFSYDPARRREQAVKVAEVLPLVRDIRRAGSAALDLCSLACGRLDAFYEAPMERWDRSAGELIAREAGALLVGLPAQPGAPPGLIGANPHLHAQLAALVTGARNDTPQA